MKKRLQRLLSGLLAAALLWALPVSAGAAGRFADVPESHWAAEEIGRAVDLGLFQGETATRFGVGHQMTRAAFAVVLCRFFGWELVKPAQATYTDVRDTSAWYYSAVETAYAHGAITLQTDTFRPADPITREEMAVMLVRALGYGTIAGLVQDLPIPFTDVDTNAGYIAMAYELGLFSGTTSTTFSPDRVATREQTAVILMRLYDKLHQAQPEQAGIAGGAGDLSGLGMVAVPACRLVYNGKVQVSHPMEEETEAAIVADARKAGAKVLLHVTGNSFSLKGTAAETADLLAAAVTEGGYDGLFLDIPKLKEFTIRKTLSALVKAVDKALGDKLLYVVVEAPAWQGIQYQGYDYGTLGALADRLVVRVAPYSRTTGGFPTAPQDPLEEVYYALGELRDVVPAQKLSLMVTTTGSVWKNGKSSGSMDAGQIEALLAEKDVAAYYSSRYACAYLTKTEEKTTTVVWYLDQQAIGQRQQLAVFFGVGQVCFSDLAIMSREVAGET